MINAEERTPTVSPCVTVVKLFIGHFIREIPNIRRKLTVSRHFRLAVKMRRKSGTTLVIVK